MESVGCYHVELFIEDLKGGGQRAWDCVHSAGDRWPVANDPARPDVS